MGRRADRERFEAMKRLDPDYKGFRGYRNEPNRRGRTPLESATCSVCGRKRNIPRGIALEQGDSYVCSTCSEEAAEAPEPEQSQAES